MRSLDKILTYFFTTLLVLSGLIYWYLKFLYSPDEGGFSVLNHPWQPYFQNIHIIVAPFFVFMVGYLWHSHVLFYLPTKNTFPKKWYTGVALIVLLPVTALSGYFYQVSSHEFWRNFHSYLHIVSSLLWSIIFIFHCLLRRI